MFKNIHTIVITEGKYSMIVIIADVVVGRAFSCIDMTIKWVPCSAFHPTFSPA